MKTITINNTTYDLKKEYKISKSPYSKSHYILKQDDYIDWGHKPENSLRISNHWNFFTGGCVHCELAHTTEKVSEWLVCEYKEGKYHIIAENEEAERILEKIERPERIKQEKEAKEWRKIKKEEQAKKRAKEENKRNNFEKQKAENICNLLLSGKTRLIEERGTGRNRRYIDINKNVVEFLELFKIKYCIKNDAPRGGQLGDYIEVNKISLKKIARTRCWDI